MNLAPVEKIVQALLYEGYMLYPYRPSALKNRQRCPFGSLYPQSWSLAHGGTDASSMQTECLVQGTPQTVVEVRVRFLQLIAAATVEVDPPWHEAGERTVTAFAMLGELVVQPKRVEFVYPTAPRQEAVELCVDLSADQQGESLFKVTIGVRNLTPFENAAARTRDEALMQSLLSTHMIIALKNGDFISLLDPPPQFHDFAAACRNVGTWPVLVGEAGSRDTMLSSPIILYDYPQIAPESPGDLFDGTEIDELLSLRLSTLAEAEEQEIIAADSRARVLLDRTKSLTQEQLLNLHGSMRGPRMLSSDESVATCAVQEEPPRLGHVRVGAVDVRPGDRVRLCPQRGADVFDLVLAGKIATVRSIEQDFEDRVYLAVTVDDDPGNDLGEQAQPGHRFFFRPDEVATTCDEASDAT